MTATCLRSGLRAAFSNRRLILTVWLWNFLLALVAGAGVWRWLGSAFDFAPEADRMLERFHFGVLTELQQYDRFSPLTFMGGTVLALIVLSAISNPLVSAGVLEVLVARDDRPLLHRFFRGAGHFFGRFLRLLAISAAAFLILVMAVSVALSPISRAFDRAGWEVAMNVTGLVRLGLLGLVAAVVMALLDLARTRVVTARTEVRGMLRTWASSVPLFFRKVGTFLGIYLALGVVWVALAGLGLAVVSATPVTGWSGIWFLIGVQQLFMIARATLRIARAGAVLELVAATAGTLPAVTAGLKAGGYPDTTEPVPPQ